MSLDGYVEGWYAGWRALLEVLAEMPDEQLRKTIDVQLEVDDLLTGTATDD